MRQDQVPFSFIQRHFRLRSYLSLLKTVPYYDAFSCNLIHFFLLFLSFSRFFSHLFSRNHYRSPDGYSSLQVLLVLISLKVRPKQRSCPDVANPYFGNDLKSRNSNTKNLELRDSALLIISLTVNCCSDPVHQDVRQLCDNLSWQDGLGPRYTFGEIKTGIQEDAPPSA